MMRTITQGSCATPGSKLHSVTCPRCTNSMAIKVIRSRGCHLCSQILESQKKLHLEGDSSEGDLVGKVVLFYDASRGSKLACGVVTRRE